VLILLLSLMFEKKITIIFSVLQEHKKVLYYFPKNTDLDTKVKQVGLCEAMVTFTQ